jgi:hypothetical protein
MAHDGVAVYGFGGGLHLAVGATQRQARVLHVVSGLAAHIGLLLAVERLQMRDHVARGGLGVGVLALLPLAQEGRQRNGGQDADDENHDEELDEREAPLLAMQTFAELPQHCVSSLR